MYSGIVLRVVAVQIAYLYPICQSRDWRHMYYRCRLFCISTKLSSSIRPARGMRDLYGAEAFAHEEIVSTFRALALRYGCSSMSTPLPQRPPFQATNSRWANSC